MYMNMSEFEWNRQLIRAGITPGSEEAEQLRRKLIAQEEAEAARAAEPKAPPAEHRSEPLPAKETGAFRGEERRHSEAHKPHESHRRHESRPAQHESRPAQHESRPAQHESRPAQHESRPVQHESRPAQQKQPRGTGFSGKSLLLILLLLICAGVVIAVITAGGKKNQHKAEDAAAVEETSEESIPAAPAEETRPADAGLPVITDEDIDYEEAPVSDIVTGPARALTDVNMRYAPDSEAEFYEILSEGEKIEILEDAGDGWCKILHNGNEVYVSSKYVMADELRIRDEFGVMSYLNFRDIGWNKGASDRRPAAYAGSYPVAVRFELYSRPEDTEGAICYQISVPGIGWLSEVTDGEETAAPENAGGINAVSIRLDGALSEQYDIYVRALIGSRWTKWFRNGRPAGDTSSEQRIEGLQVTINKKNAGYPADHSEWRIDPEKPMVALTFDDGPKAEVTNRILNALEETGSRATFFCLGVRVNGDGNDCLRRMAADGSEIACHTYDHENLAELDKSDIVYTVRKANHLIAMTCGVEPIVMRPPGGSSDEHVDHAIGGMKLPAILWSVDTLDWKTRDADETVDTVLSNVTDGDIILMHDVYEETADAAVRIIPALVEKGYQLVTVSELAAARGGMRDGTEYHAFHR